MRIVDNHCFTMPIIIFKEHPSALEYRIGQLNHDQTVSTIAMPWIEQCKFDRFFFHVIGTEVHVFEDYKRLSVTSLDKLYDHALRLEENVNHLEKVKRGRGGERNTIEPLLANTQFIDIYTKYEPKLSKPVVLGFKETESYSYKQKRKIISSFEDLLAHINSARNDDKVLTSSTQGDTSQTDGISNPILSGVKVLTDGIGDSVHYVFDKAGGVLDNTFDSAGNALGGIADFVSGGFMKLLIIVASVAVAGLFLYALVKNKLLASDEDDTRKQFPSYPQQDYRPPPYESLRKRDKREQESLTEF